MLLIVQARLNRVMAVIAFIPVGLYQVAALISSLGILFRSGSGKDRLAANARRCRGCRGVTLPPVCARVCVRVAGNETWRAV